MWVQLRESTRTARTGMLLGLMAYAVFAPGSALSDEDPDLLARSFACERVQQATVFRDSVCDESGLLCESTSEGCEKFCQNSSRACSSLGRSAALALTRQIAFEHRGLSRLCRAESDAAACRALLRSSKNRLRQEAREYAEALATSCASVGFGSSCYETCTDEMTPLPDCSADALADDASWAVKAQSRPEGHSGGITEVSDSFEAVYVEPPGFFSPAPEAGFISASFESLDAVYVESAVFLSPAPESLPPEAAISASGASTVNRPPVGITSVLGTRPESPTSSVATREE